MSSVELKVEYDLLKTEYDQLKSNLDIVIEAFAIYKLIIAQLKKGEKPILIERTDSETGELIESNADFIDAFNDRGEVMNTFFTTMGFSILQVIDRLHIETDFFVEVARKFIKDSYVGLHAKQSEMLTKRQEVIDQLLFENMLQF